jgi:hypothetical protein
MKRFRQLVGLLRRQELTGDPVTSALPIMVHTHPKNELPAGPLEQGMLEFEQEGLVFHAIAEIVRPDGTFADLDEDRIEWARRLSYNHLKRERCLEAYGIPIMPAYEKESPV